MISAVFKNRVLGRNLQLRRRNEKEAGENCIMRGFVILYSTPNIVTFTKCRQMRWAGM
jgi:hypothetical protein